MAKISAIQFGLRMATLFANEGKLLQAGRTAAPTLYLAARKIASGARRKYRGSNTKIKTVLSGIAFDSIFKVIPQTRSFLNGELAK